MRVLPPLLSVAALAGMAEAPAPAQDLDPVEGQLVDHVDAHLGEALELLQRAVDINSGTNNFAGVREVGLLFAAELDGLGFSTRWIEGAPFGRAGHLVAERQGQGPRVLLIGHLDTVFEPDSPFQRFERLSETSARGPGVIDMKGGNVVMLQALRALAAAGTLDRLGVTVVLTGDEEDSGDPLAEARAALFVAADQADVALGFEDGDGDPATAVVARRGSSGWTLRVSGKPAHSSQIFRDDIGAGAIFEAARILEGFRERLVDEPDLTFNPGTFLGGTEVTWDADEDRGTAFGKSNVIAETVVVEGDLRATSPEQLERARGVMREVIAASLPHTSAEISFDDGYPPMAVTDGNLRLLAAYDRASRDLGFGPVAAVDPRRAGAADISFVADRVEMALDGLGLMGDDGHTVDETADLTTLPSQAKRAALLLHRLATGVLAEPSQP